MCLAVPGKVLTIKRPEDGGTIGTLGQVDFQGSRLEVSLDFIPDVEVGDYVLVHAGYALNKINEDEAREVWEYLKQMDEMELEELQDNPFQDPDGK